MMDEALKGNVRDINNRLMTAALLGSAAAWAAAPDGGGWNLAAWTFGVLGSGQGIVGLKGIAKDFAMRKKIHEMSTKGSGAHTARWATEDEMQEAGMFDGIGRPLGITESGRAFFEPHKLRPVHSKTMGTSGAGKTIGAIVPAIMHLAFSSQRPSLIVPVLKGELVAQCAPPLIAAGLEVWVVDDMNTTPFQKTALNILEPIVSAASLRSPDAASLARNFALMLEPEPPGDGKNKFFRDGNRDCIRLATEAMARMAPEECTPSAVHQVLGDSELFAELQEKAIEAGGGLATAAGRLQDLKEEHPQHYTDFRTTALQKLEIYEEGGLLDGAGAGAVRRYEEVRERQIIVFLVSSLQHMKDLKVHTMLHVSNFLHVCKRPGHAVTLIIDEFTNLPIQTLSEDLTIIRGFGSRVILAGQAESEVERQFSPNLARTIDGLMSIRQIMGVTRFDEAKRVSEATGRGAFAATSLQGGEGRISESLSDSGRPLLTPDEVLSLPREKQVVFCEGMRPILANKLSQNQIEPMCSDLAANPLEGGKLRADPVVRVEYAKREGTKADRVVQLGRVTNRNIGPRPPRLLRLAYFTFVGWWAAFGFAALGLSGAHLRASYEYRLAGQDRYYESCSYLGARGHFTVSPTDGVCPLIKWRWHSTG